MMGYDVWSEGVSETEYLNDCRSSSKYDKGDWYALVIDNKPVSSLVFYKDCFNLPKNYIGIGSVSTKSSHRRSGYASILINEICKEFTNQSIAGIYLHSDIGKNFYEKLGFESINSNTINSSDLMLKKLNIFLAKEKSIPDYF